VFMRQQLATNEVDSADTVVPIHAEDLPTPWDSAATLLDASLTSEATYGQADGGVSDLPLVPPLLSG
jgi:hypothetical protein